MQTVATNGNLHSTQQRLRSYQASELTNDLINCGSVGEPEGRLFLTASSGYRRGAYTRRRGRAWLFRVVGHFLLACVVFVVDRLVLVYVGLG